MFYQLEYTPGQVGSPGAHRKLLTCSCNFSMLKILLISNGHLVPALIAVSRLIVLSGNMYSHRVDRYTRLVRIRSGRLFAKYVMGAIVG